MLEVAESSAEGALRSEVGRLQGENESLRIMLQQLVAAHVEPELMELAQVRIPAPQIPVLCPSACRPPHHMHTRAHNLGRL